MSDEQLSTISEVFYETCEKFASRQAQLFNPDLYHNDNQGCFIYQQMQDRVEKIAYGLLALGFEKNEMAAIMSTSSPYWTQADYAIINCGGITVTIFPTLTFNEASYIINDSQSRYLFVGHKDMLARILPGMDKLSSLKKIIVLDMEYLSDNEHVMGLKELLALGEEYEAQYSIVYKNRWQSNTLDDWATIIYTSGTTGQGKGAILTHRSISSRLYHTLKNFTQTGINITEEDVYLSFLPLAHVYERGCGQMMAVFTGACIAYADKPSTIMQDMQKYNPTVFNCVPRLYERIYITIQEQMSKSPIKRLIFKRALAVGKKVLDYRTDSHGRINMALDFDVTSQLPLWLRLAYGLSERVFVRIRALFGNRFKYCFSASAGIAAELATMFYIIGIRIIEGYGLTETSTACNLNPLIGIKPGKVGPAANGSLGKLANDGEYLTSGAGLFIGYLNKLEETADAFTHDGWFKTGDIGEIDEDGYLKIVDRKKAIVVLSTGKKIAPVKIENLFATSSIVEQVFVVGDDKKFITALIVPNFDYLIELLDKENIAYDKSKLIYSSASGVPICIQVGEDFVAQPMVQKLIAQEVSLVNGNLEGFEAIKKHAILSKRFTEESHEITPTLKYKKRVILNNYQEAITELYQN